MYSTRERQERLFFLGAVGLAVIGWSLFLYFAGPTFLVDAIGVENGYILGFLVAALGGMSTVTSVSFYTVVTALAAAGLNPFLLGLVMGSGVTVGDTVFFYLGRTGRQTLPHRIQYHVDQTLEWAYEQRGYVIHLVVFSWAAFMPLPNDLITIPTGISRFEAYEILPFLLAGNITFTTLLSLVVGYGLFG